MYLQYNVSGYIITTLEFNKITISFFIVLLYDNKKAKLHNSNNIIIYNCITIIQQGMLCFI